MTSVALRHMMALESLIEGKEAAQPIITEYATPTQADFARMIRRRRTELHAITDKLIDGQLSTYQWADQMQAILLEGHTHAWQMGRNLSGDLRDDVNDLLRGIERSDEERFYLHGFLDAINAKYPRYWDDGALKFRETIKSRQDLYLGKMRGTANEAFVQHTPSALDSFDWTLGGTEDHCAECPEYASMSPWQKSTIFANPGDGSTPCLTNCLCHWTRIDGQTSFKPVEL